MQSFEPFCTPIPTLTATFATIVITFFCIAFASCGYGGGGAFVFSGNQPNERVGGTLKDVSAPPVSGKTYTFLLLSDIHCGVEAENELPKTRLAETIALHNPQFVIVTGDLTEAGTESDYRKWKDFAAALKATGVPLYTIPGNHDLYNGGWQRWLSSSETDASFYRFTLKDADRSFYFLDTASGTLGKKQLDAFAAALTADTRKKFVFSHYAVYGSPDMNYYLLTDTHERAELLSLAVNNGVSLFFAGHYHENKFFTSGGFAELTCGSVKKDRNDTRHWTFVSVDEDAGKVTFSRYDVPGPAAPVTWTHMM